MDVAILTDNFKDEQIRHICTNFGTIDDRLYRHTFYPTHRENCNNDLFTFVIDFLRDAMISIAGSAGS